MRVFDSSDAVMADLPASRTFSVPTVRSGRCEVKCPICGSAEFLSTTPDIDRAKREGFRNVIVGMYGDAAMAALPVKFQHCANCGYVLQFIIGKFPDGEQQ